MEHKKLFNRVLLTFSLVVAAALAFAACTNTEIPLGLNADANGLALRGFDAVAYFAVDSAVKGDVKYEFAWNGAKWLFSSEENMKRFQADPEAYAPQFGGYCSYAVSEGYTADGDPDAWKIVDGRLYLNYNKKVKEKWEENEAERIDKGTINWQQFRKKKPEHKG